MLQGMQLPRWQLSSYQAGLVRAFYKSSSIGNVYSHDDYRCIGASRLMTRKVKKTIKKYLVGECLAMLGFCSLYP
eukprot:12409080-Karenia_brevis.AAC.1